MLAPHGYLLAASTFPFFNTAARPKTARDTDHPIVMQTNPAQQSPNQDRHAVPVSWGWLVHSCLSASIERFQHLANTINASTFSVMPRS